VGQDPKTFGQVVRAFLYVIQDLSMVRSCLRQGAGSPSVYWARQDGAQARPRQGELRQGRQALYMVWSNVLGQPRTRYVRLWCYFLGYLVSVVHDPKTFAMGANP
jgi:hypothetical protein